MINNNSYYVWCTGPKDNFVRVRGTKISVSDLPHAAVWSNLRHAKSWSIPILKKYPKAKIKKAALKIVKSVKL